MTDKRKVTFILEGHSDPVDAFTHEASKLASEGNSKENLEVTMTTEPIYEFDKEEQDNE